MNSSKQDRLSLKNSELFRKEVAALTTNELYSETLLAQTELYWPTTQQFLNNNEPWKKAQHVLDVGCGPGEVLRRLINNFPQKKYSGVDADPNFIERARKVLAGQNVELHHADIFKFAEKKYDAVLLWAVLQHLGDPVVAVRHLAKFLNPGGSAFFYDANGNTEISATPAIPLLSTLYRELKEKAQGQRNADCLSDVQKKIAELPFEIVQVEDVSVMLGSERDETYVRFSYFVSELVGRFYDIKADQAALLKELLAWLQSPEHSVRTDNGRWLVLRRI
jgi:2-polyprenyl-3-methyl-5-hydroxy-6-metoxy-1,4-benzoquinol methylase